MHQIMTECDCEIKSLCSFAGECLAAKTNEKSLLPDCMLPDGGDPCEAFSSACRERDRWRHNLRRIIHLYRKIEAAKKEAEG